jgi:hypothetical protein
MYAVLDDPSATQTVDRRRREPAMTVQQAVPVPAIREAVSGWTIGPASANRGSNDRLDQTIQKYHEQVANQGNEIWFPMIRCMY